MRLGLFGGTFDPIHYGHLLLAETCRAAQQLDQVWFLPAALAPHKQGQLPTEAPHRVAMIELAIAGQEAFHASPIEIERGGISYTIDTLRAIHDEDPARELFLLVGADTLHDLPNWKSPADVCTLATLIVVRREGAFEPDFTCLERLVSSERIARFQEHQVEMPPIGLSSTKIRDEVAQGQTIRYQTPRAVEQYLETHGLYGIGSRS